MLRRLKTGMLSGLFRPEQFSDMSLYVRHEPAGRGGGAADADTLFPG